MKFNYEVDTFLRSKPYKGNQSRLKRYSDINESPCQHNYTCKGKQPSDPEVIDDILQSLLNMNGKFESIANFVDEVIVYKVDTMNTILGEEGVISNRIALLTVASLKLRQVARFSSCFS